MSVQEAGLTPKGEENAVPLETKPQTERPWSSALKIEGRAR